MQKDPLAAAREVAAQRYGVPRLERADGVLEDLVALFSGRFDGYHGCDTTYHNLDHTYQVIDPYVGILDGWVLGGRAPRVPFATFELGLVAVLLHDTGYIRRRDEEEGTGGQFTFVHIERSIGFARRHLPRRGFLPAEIESIGSMIRCTGVADRIQSLTFASGEDRICGYALGTADLLGQIAAEDYPDKLDDLYREFHEAYEHEGYDALRERGVTLFASAEDLLDKTPYFFERVVRTRFEEMASLDQVLWRGRPERAERYHGAIARNLARISRTAR